MENDNLKKGVCLIIFSAFCFALMAMLSRMSGDIPFIQKTLFRNIFAFIVAFTILIKEQNKNRIAKNGISVFTLPHGSFKFLLLRAMAGTIGIFGNFYAIDRLNIADASILNKMSPFFTLIFSFFLLGEKIDLIPLIAVFGAFGGAILVMKPSFDFVKFLPSIAGFLSGLGAGFAYSCVRKLHQYKVNGTLIIVFFSAFSSLCAVPFIILNFQPMTLRQILLLAGTGIAATGGQFGITYAYFNAPASKISIFDYSQIIFSALMGYFAFNQIPDLLSFIGYVVIISMAVIVFIYNKQKMSDSTKK